MFLARATGGVDGALTYPATAMTLGAWDAAADALGIHNVFRYLFDTPTGAITNPPLLSISFGAFGNPVIGVATPTE